MSHVYVKPGRFKNRNCRYALIGGTVFPSVYDAEEYCAKKGLDVNSCIEADNPKTLAECKRIARATLPELTLLLDKCQQAYDALYAKALRTAEAYNAAEARKELGWEIHEKWKDEAFGAVSGFSDCLNLIREYSRSLMQVLSIRG